MPSDQTAAAALANFAGYSAPTHLTRLKATGFSGCVIWRVAELGEQLCLKCWPAENPPPERLPWVHQVLQRAIADGLTFLPQPKQCREGGTICEFADCSWELMTWLPGEANYHALPSEQKLQNAFQTLATFHRATRSFGPHVTARPLPAIADRLAHLSVLADWKSAHIQNAVNQYRIPELDTLAHQWLATRREPPADYRRRLLDFIDYPGPLQPAIRDLWHDHVLFTGDEVTGFIDFGAMRLDTPLVDIARLLGSLTRDDADQRNLALDAYSEIRPLSPGDRNLIHLLDHASAWLAGWNWLEWLYLDRREFPSLHAVRDRLQELLSRQPQHF